DQFKATDNLLLCISVDSEAWANTTWPDNKDVGTVYGANCYLGVESLEKDNASITSHGNTISITGEGSVTIYNLLGAMVHQQKLSPGVNQIPLRSGIYLVRSGSTTRKIQLRLD
ncbi:MAG: T9SS type A sorting domain-containing protein, partial [Flavobacteriales bacterium]|nr:T9SS type A sorting domain-containing protein [Flavobacteriales bacterium]